MQTLAAQSGPSFEVIVVDQNDDDRIVAVLAEFSRRLQLTRLRAPVGLSKARNLGLTVATGTFIAFPDDDCWYGKTLLADMQAAFEAHPQWDGILTDCHDETGAALLPWIDRAGEVAPSCAWRRSPTFAIFLRRQVVTRVGGFDEKLGPNTGMPWLSGEDTDYMLRTLQTGFSVQYEPALVVYHPRHFQGFSDAAIMKKYRYALGDGTLLRKHPMPWWWTAAFFMLPLSRAILSALRLSSEQRRFHWLTFRGRWQGYRGTVGSAYLDSIHPSPPR
jgi:GT2 family glycosyltransferase